MTTANPASARQARRVMKRTGTRRRSCGLASARPVKMPAHPIRPRAHAVYALATSYEQHGQRGRQHQVQGGHRVVGGAVIEEGERRYQQRVVGRMEIRQHDELPRWMWNDLEFELLLQRQVVNGAAALEHEQPRPGIKGEEIRALKVAPNKGEPITHPEEKRPESGAGGCRVAHSAPMQ